MHTVSTEITIGKKKYPVRFGNMPLVILEREFPKTEKSENMVITRSFEYIYCCLKAGAAYIKQDLDITLDEFIMACDDDPSIMETLTKARNLDEESPKPTA